MRYRELLSKIECTINEFMEYHKINPNRIILSRNYVNIIKREFDLYDVEMYDDELVFKDIPIVIDECSVNKIEVAFSLVRHF